LEFERKINPDISSPQQEEEMMSIFKDCLVKDIKNRFDLDCDPLQDIIDLDSSTAHKFSRHLIVHLHGAIFENNAAVGHYVRNMCARIEARMLLEGEDQNTRQQLAKLFVNAHADHDIDHPQPKKTIFADLSVYSKNRQFRLYLSSKIGKEAVFLPASTKSLLPSPPSLHKRKIDTLMDHIVPDKDIFYKSLVSDSILKPDTKILTDVLSADEKQIQHKIGLGKKDTSQLQSAPLPSSPFEEIDNFVLDHIKNLSGYESTYFRTAAFFPDCKDYTTASIFLILTLNFFFFQL
jgi:hypothetical protein